MPLRDRRSRATIPRWRASNRTMLLQTPSLLSDDRSRTGVHRCRGPDAGARGRRQRRGLRGRRSRCCCGHCRIADSDTLVILNHRDLRTGITKEFIAIGDYVDLRGSGRPRSKRSSPTVPDRRRSTGDGEPLRAVRGLGAGPGLLRHRCAFGCPRPSTDGGRVAPRSGASGDDRVRDVAELFRFRPRDDRPQRRVGSERDRSSASRRPAFRFPPSQNAPRSSSRRASRRRAARLGRSGGCSRSARLKPDVSYEQARDQRRRTCRGARTGSSLAEPGFGVLPAVAAGLAASATRGRPLVLLLARRRPSSC